LNLITEELRNLVVACGGTPSAVDDTQISTVLAPKISGILSHATDTGVVSTDHKRVVVGATASQANGVNSVVVGGNTNTASGTNAQVSGGTVNRASGADAQVSGGYGNTSSGSESQISGGSDNVASGYRSHVAGSRNVELNTPNAVGGGYDAGTAITPSDANQNLSWLLNSDGGHAHFAGTAKIGGDVDAGTGEKISLNGSNGLVSVDFDGPDACAYASGKNWSVTKNVPSGLITVVNNSNHALNTGDEMTITLTNSLITSGSAVIGIVSSCTTIAATLVGTAPASGSVVFTLRNVGSNGDVGVAWAVGIRFVVIGEL